MRFGKLIIIITGRMNIALSLAGRKINFILKLFLYLMYKDE